jgi:hypothetical protein
MMARRPLVLGLLVSVGCGGTEVGLDLVFPDSASHEATTLIATTAFEPLAPIAAGGTLDFLPCGTVGAFHPAHAIRPDEDGFARFRQRFSDVRETHALTKDGWSLSIPRPTADAQNPWGAVMVFVEARVEAVQWGAGAPSSESTLLEGCTCFRTADGIHRDVALDRRVKNACPELDDPMRASDLELHPIVDSAHHLEACDIQTLTAPKNQRLYPGPGACVRADPGASHVPDCLGVSTTCTNPDDLSGVPILFMVDQPDGRTTVEANAVITDPMGEAHTPLLADGCDARLRLRGAIAGEAVNAVEWVATCVDGIAGFSAAPDVPLSGGGAIRGITTIPGASPDPDLLAIMYEGSATGSIELLNPAQRATPIAHLDYPGERPRAIVGFSYQLGPNDHMGTRPALALVTTIGEPPNTVTRLYVYAWTQGQLVLQPGAPFTEACGQSMCGPSTIVDCALQPDFSSRVHLAASDVDGDRFADLAIGTDAGLAVTIYGSRARGTAEDAMYAQQGCACANYATPPATFELVRLGTPSVAVDPPLVDLVLGGAGGARLRYAMPDKDRNEVLACGSAEPLGFADAIQDIGRGRFQCDSWVSAGACENYEDAVIVGPEHRVRVVYGSTRDLGTNPQLPDPPDSRIDLDAQAILHRDPPKDPDAARSGLINGDRFDDLAVLYAAAREVHVWLGAGNRALGEVPHPIDLEAASACDPLPAFALADLDASGQKQIAVVCDPEGSAPRLRRFVAMP